MGYLMSETSIEGEAQDVETIIRLRPWIEDEWCNTYGKYSDSKLITDYDAKSNIFRFKIVFER